MHGLEPELRRCNVDLFTHGIERPTYDADIGAKCGCSILLFPIQKCIVPPFGRLEQSAGSLQHTLINRSGRTFRIPRKLHKIVRFNTPNRERRPQFNHLVVDVVDLIFVHLLQMEQVRPKSITKISR